MLSNSNRTRFTFWANMSTAQEPAVKYRISATEIRRWRMARFRCWSLCARRSCQMSSHFSTLQTIYRIEKSIWNLGFCQAKSATESHLEASGHTSVRITTHSTRKPMHNSFNRMMCVVFFRIRSFSDFCVYFEAEVLWSWCMACCAPGWTWHTSLRSWCCGASQFWLQQLGSFLWNDEDIEKDHEGPSGDHLNHHEYWDMRVLEICDMNSVGTIRRSWPPWPTPCRLCFWSWAKEMDDSVSHVTRAAAVLVSKVCTVALKLHLFRKMPRSQRFGSDSEGGCCGARRLRWFLAGAWRRWRATTSGVAGDLRETLWGRRVQHIWKTSKDVQSHRSKAKQETIRKHHEKVWKSKEKQTGLPEWPECNSLQIQMHLQTTMATFGTSKVHMSSWHAMTPFIPINLICFCQAICFSWLDKLPQECVDWLQKRGAKEVGLVGHSRGGVTISQLEGDFCRVTWKRKQK